MYFVGILNVSSAGIFKQSMGARNRVGRGLSFRTVRLHAGEIDSLESILGPFKSLKNSGSVKYVLGLIGAKQCHHFFPTIMRFQT
jgi:hypothetical protein